MALYVNMPSRDKPFSNTCTCLRRPQQKGADPFRRRYTQEKKTIILKALLFMITASRQ